MRCARIVLCLLMFLPFVLAQNIELTYPDGVSFGEEFEINLRLADFDSGVYDVKIDITKDDTRVSRILVDESWKSTFYYVQRALDGIDSADFILKISEEVSGELDMIVRIREDGKSSSELFEGYVINIVDSPRSEEPMEDEKPPVISDVPSEEGAPTGVPTSEDTGKDEGKDDDDEDSNETNESIEKNVDIPIKLKFENSKDIKSESSINFYKNLFAFGGIFGISVFLGLVYWTKQGKYKNEFR
jgi:hypothetical protein